MSFGTVIELIKLGYGCSRESWDNPEIIIFIDETADKNTILQRIEGFYFHYVPTDRDMLEK